MAGDGAVCCSAPGKLILFGEHSMVYGKPGVAVSAGGPLRCFASVRASAPGDAGGARVTLRLDAFGESITWRLSDLRDQLTAASGGDGELSPHPPPPFAPTTAVCLGAGVVLGPATAPHMAEGAARTALDAAAGAVVADLRDGGTIQPAVLVFLFLFGSIWLARDADAGDVTVRVWSTLPVGAGMGSSASYSVAVAAALLQAVQAGDDTAAGQWPVDGVAASAELRELVNAWALECERLFHGNPSGVDNTVCSHGARPLAARRFAALTRWGRLRCPRRSGAVPQVCRPADAVAGHPPPAVPRHQHERARPLHDAHGRRGGHTGGRPAG